MPGWPTLSRAAGDARGRLRQVQAQSRGRPADSRVVRPFQRSQRRAVHAARPDGDPAQAARGPDHPQVDEGGPRSLGLRLRDRAARRRRLVDGTGRVRHRIGRAVVVGAVAAFALRTWLVKLSQVPARTPLRAAHARAGRRRRLDRVLPRRWSTPASKRHARSIAAAATKS